MSTSRSKVFSGKLKKEQLQAKRAAKAERQQHEAHRQQQRDQDGDEVDNEAKGESSKQGAAKKTSVPPELRSVFATESKETVNKKTQQTWKPYKSLSPEDAFECDVENYYGNEAVIELPKRPPWQYGMSKAAVEANEAKMFQHWKDAIYAKYKTEDLSYFEHNLEVWRQLWRVVEMSDIVLLIVDIRHPLVHFSPALYHWVNDELKRPMVLVLNKIDLVAPDVVRAWEAYFHQRFPGLHTASFSCYSLDTFAFSDDKDGSTATETVAKRTNARRKRYHRSVGVRDILNACHDVDITKRDQLVDWQAIIERYSKEADFPNNDDEGSDESSSEEDEEQTKRSVSSTSSQDMDEGEFGQAAVPHRDYITIGLVGHPNVGKSSLINGIMGKTVVSASRTPGHTKHFQTIHLTENVRLSDCPGLVFPSLLPKPVQILSGMFNIAQVREPFSVVQYLAERVQLPELLDIVHPSLLEDEDDQHTKSIKITQEMRNKPHPPWTAWAVCEGFAYRKGFFTAKAGRPDVYRAANLILRLAFDGRLLLSMKPRGYYAQKAVSTGIVKRIEREKLSEPEDEEVSDESDDSAEGKSHMASVASANAFALLQDDDDNLDDDEEES